MEVASAAYQHLLRSLPANHDTRHHPCLSVYDLQVLSAIVALEKAKVKVSQNWVRWRTVKTAVSVSSSNKSKSSA